MILDSSLRNRRKIPALVLLDKIMRQIFCDYEHLWHSRITSKKFSSVFIKTHSASFTDPTVLLPQSRDNSYYVSRTILAPQSLCRNTLIYAHTTSPTLLPCDISIGPLIFPAPEAGEFVELILLYAAR